MQIIIPVCRGAGWKTHPRVRGIPDPPRRCPLYLPPGAAQAGFHELPWAAGPCLTGGNLPHKRGLRQRRPVESSQHAGGKLCHQRQILARDGSTPAARFSRSPSSSPFTGTMTLAGGRYSGASERRRATYTARFRSPPSERAASSSAGPAKSQYQNTGPSTSGPYPLPWPWALLPRWARQARRFRQWLRRG